MYKYTAKLVMFVVIILTSCAVLYLLPTKYNHDLSLMVNKLDILKQCKGKKIVFIGGSNLLVGLDSKLVKDKLNYEVVNLGLFANFGINFLLNETKPFINEGDIVVITPEYSVLFGDRCFWPVEPQGVTWALAFSPYNTVKNVYSVKQNFEKIPRDLSEIYRNKLTVIANYVTQGNIRGAFGRGRDGYSNILDEYGDAKVDSFPKLPPEQIEGHGAIFPDKITEESKFSDLNSFNSYARSKGATVYFFFPCFPSLEYAQNTKQFDTAYRQLKENLAFDVLGTPENFIFDSKYFSNTVNHLTREGRLLRTNEVIALLSKQITND